MRGRRISFESLENRQLLNAGPIDDSATPPLSTSPVSEAESVVQHSLLRFQSDGSLLRNGTDQLAQHWPSDTHKADWQPKLTGDFNNDGLDDVFAQLESDEDGVGGASWLHLNDGKQFFLVQWGEALAAGTEIIGSGDVNNDGLLDIISINKSTNEVWVSVNDLQSGFRNELWARWSSSLHTELMVGDFDQDGRTDVLAGETGGTWSLARSTGDRFAVESWGPYAVFEWHDVVSGDFNNDSYPDIAARAPDRTWWVWQGSDTGFAPAQYSGHWKMGTTWTDVRVADFNADGHDDLIGRNEDGFLWVATSVTPQGTESKIQFHTWRWVTGWVTGADWRNVSIADITGDGLPDQIGQARDGLGGWPRTLVATSEIRFWIDQQRRPTT